MSGMGYTNAPDGWWKAFIQETPARTAKLGIVRKDGSPHVSPVWITLDGDDIIFMTSRTSLKGKAILRDGRVSICLDDERPPFAFLTIAGTATTSENLDELLEWGTKIGGRYMGEENGAKFGERNAVSGELLVRVKVDRVTAKVDVAG